MNQSVTHTKPQAALLQQLPTLLNRICVKAPYYALENLELTGETLTATAPIELSRGFEQAPISAPEVGRHASILGSCAIALAQRDDTLRYYLAQGATMHSYPVRLTANTIHYQAQLEQLDKRQALTTVVVKADEQPLAELSIRFGILTQGAFERLFRAHEQPGVVTPGYRAELSGSVRREADRISFHAPVVPREVCSGHFPNHPALPVAVLMNYLVRLGGDLIDGPFRSVFGDMTADELCWAGESLTFEVKRTRLEGRRHYFEGQARSQGRVKGEMRFSLDALDNAP